METYKREIKERLALSIQDLPTRLEKEREGIKCFIKYAISTPNVYNIIWGSLSIDRQMFVDYYVSFADGYSKALAGSGDEISLSDTDSVAYMLMGISNFLGLKAMFTKMSDEEIDKMVNDTVMPALTNGIINKKTLGT